MTALYGSPLQRKLTWISDDSARCAAPAFFCSTLGVNGRLFIAAFSGEFSADYVLLRYIAALLIGYVGMRIMDSILFRPRPPSAVEPTGPVEALIDSNAETT